MPTLVRLTEKVVQKKLTSSLPVSGGVGDTEVERTIEMFYIVKLITVLMFF